METYLVGGAVRDELLGLPVSERDWVVVGATPDALRALGYRQVGRDFPVFIHPETGEEYALARRERKVSAGHTGFVCEFGPEVSLEEDLQRRDLTINAMARRADGTLVDPWGGSADIACKRLRHVSAAFAEDPLRVFRVARFAARFAPLGFTVAEETLQLMRTMAASGSLKELAAERVWQELEKAFAAASPAEFIRVLGAARALADWLPELDGENGSRAVALLERVTPLLDSSHERYGALGWLLSPDDAEGICARLKAPRSPADLLGAIARHGRDLAGYRRLDPSELLRVMKATGALRRARAFEAALRIVGACTATDLTLLADVAKDLRVLGTESLRARGLEGRALGAALDEDRARLIERRVGVA